MRLLHIAHNWGGGLPKWVNDFSKTAEANHHESYILACIGDGKNYGSSYSLYKNGFDQLLEKISIDVPILETAVHNEGYERLLGMVLEKYKIDKLIVSSVIGHSLDVFKFDLPKIFVVHDYFPFCPALNLYNGGQCQQCDNVSLVRCVQTNELSSLFKRSASDFWISERSAFKHALKVSNTTMVFPDVSTRRNLLKVDPEFASIAFQVIPHGIDLRQLDCFGGAEEGRKLRILLPGRFTLDKGNEFIKSIVPTLLGRFELFPYGTGDAGVRYFSQFQEVGIIREYKQESMGRDLSAIKPDLAILASKVPETFSYTLSEMNNFGIPVVANRIGSFESRIKEGMGFLFDQTAKSLSERVEFLNINRHLLRTVSLGMRKAGTRSVLAMVNDYVKILETV